MAEPSVNPGGDERRVAGVVEDVCADLGLPAPRRLGLASRPNLMVDLDFGPGGRSLGLCGHLDTKPIGDGEWETDPFVATVVGDELRGRGVVDMKGALAAMMLAASDLVSNPPGAGRVSLVFCADEENGARHGAQWLTAQGRVNVDAMVIGEPGGIDRDWDRLHVGSRGICNFDVDIKTEQGHSGLKDLMEQPSATEFAAKILVELATGFEPSVDGDSDWQPTMNAGAVIEGGTAYGVVPGHARIASDCRIVPGMEEAGFLNELLELVNEIVPADVSSQVKVRDWIPPMLVAADHEVVVSARKTLSAVLGSLPPLDLFPATTDASWFAGAGIPTLPALGPGLLRYAHGRDERISMSALDEARLVYRLLAVSFCGGSR